MVDWDGFVTMPASNFWNFNGGKRVRATGADLDFASKPKKSRTHSCFENHIRAGVGHKNAGNTALGAQIGRPAPTPWGAFNKPASILFPTAIIIFEVERAFRPGWSTHESDSGC